MTEKWPVPLVASIIFFIGSMCLASDNLLLEEIRNYQAANFAQSVEFGNRIIKNDPANSTARYYLAGALMKLGKTQEAVAEYSACARLTTDPMMQSYCMRALSSLATKSSDDQDKSKAAPQTAGAPRMNNSDASLLKTLQEVEDQKKELVRKCQEALDSNKNFWKHLAKLGDHFPASAEKFNAEALKKPYQKRIDDLDEQIAALESQLKPGLEPIQVIPLGSGINVKNFVNYSNEPAKPISLKAHEGSLDDSNQSKNSSKSGSN